ncbi:hypothetical protein AB0B31_33320 [Catellatospora citrea]|uniref:hypothetical protein n=1 Tax=Catellatospora citrea TaxID=53366 RepID=UPI0033CA43CD
MESPLSPDDVAQLIEQAAETGDLALLRRLADAGSTDALDQLVESATEQENYDELRRLAAAGNQDAADILAELDADT